MKRRSIVALGLTVVLAAALAAATSGATKKATANSITVWLQVDAQSGWPDLVAAVNQKFQADHPGTSVNVQYQNWTDHLQKFDATLAGGGGPDVIEMGNTEMTKYMAAGAFASLDKSTFDNSSSWLSGLAASGRYGGKTYGVPYYAGSRVVTYRKDLFKSAGISKLPASTAEYLVDAKKLLAKNSQKGFSPVYIAGMDWYVAMGFVFDYGGAIATQVSGQWKGLLASPRSIAGLTAFKNFFARHLARVEDERRDASEPLHRVRAGVGRVDGRPELVQLLRREEVHRFHGSVRHAGPRQGPGDAGLPGRFRPRRAGHELEQGARGRLDQGLHLDELREGSAGEGQHPERHQPARQQRQRAGGAAELVRSDGEALGRRRERQHPAQHAGADPHRQAVREAGSAVGQRQHRHGAEPAVTVHSTSPTAAAAETTLHRSRRRRRFWERTARGAVPYALIAPVVVVVGLVVAYPIYWLVKLSTEQYGLFQLIQHHGTSVGLANYRSVLHDPIFWRTLLRTVVFTAANVTVTMVLGMLIALLLVRLSAAVRILLTSGLVLVWSMPVVVAVQIFYWMTNFQNGVVNYVLTQLRLGDFNQHDWYATTFSQLGLVTVLIVWGALPFVVVTLYAGLAQVPRDLLEAAEVDGARPWRVFRDITVPILRPILLILTSLSIIWDFGVFTQPYLLIGQSKITPGNYLMSIYLFEEGYFKSDFGRGAAISILMLLIVAVLSVFYVRKMVRIGTAQ